MFTELPNFTPQNQAGGKCSTCNQHARERNGVRARVFRLNLFIHMEGWVELCEWCIAEGGAAIGMIPTAQAEELEALLVSEQAGNERLREELEDARGSVKVLAASLAIEAEQQAAKVKQSYERGYDQGAVEAKLESVDGDGVPA